VSTGIDSSLKGKNRGDASAHNWGSKRSKSTEVHFLSNCTAMSSKRVKSSSAASRTTAIDSIWQEIVAVSNEIIIYKIYFQVCILTVMSKESLMKSYIVKVLSGLEKKSS
jgi:hypothetical protein